MRYCPNCRSEFEDWAQECHVCLIPLVDELPPVQAKIKKRVKRADEPADISTQSPPEDDEIITIAKFSFPQVAHVYSAQLEAAGIPCFVADEYIVTMDWFYLKAIGLIRLQVLGSDVAEARRVLGWSPDSEDTRDSCPQCGSSDTRDVMLPVNILLLLLLYLTTIVMFFLYRKVECNYCGYKWKTRSGLFSAWDWH